MKFLKITAAILSLALLTACNSAQSVQTSGTVSESEMSAVATAAETTAKTETQTEAPAITTTAAETETEQSADELAFDNELVSALADIIESHNGGRFFMYDFDRDGCPEIAFYGYDMITAYFDIYDFSSGEAVSMGAVTPGECSLNADNTCLADRYIDDGCLEFYYSKDADEYLYVSLLRYADGSGGEALTFVQMMLRMPVNGDIDFGRGVTEEKYTYSGKSEEDWYAARNKAWESLSDYELIEHINLQTVKLYTVYDPSPYDPSPRELAVTVLKDYYTGE